MATYYEMLEVTPGASHNEVEEACERLYLKWKGLVTHHDPATAAQANQAIQQIETIRTTLTDPAKRSVYDQAIGVNGVTGGLVDLTAIGGASAPGAVIAPPPPRPVVAAPTPATPAVASGIWACPNEGCGADNPAQTKFCFKCGTQLVQDCPNCGEMTSLIATGRCGECGFSHEVGSQRRELRGRVAQLNDEVNRLRRQKNQLMLERDGKKGWIWLLILGGFVVLIGLSALAGGSEGGGLITLLIGGALLWGAFASHPAKRFDTQIQSVQDQIRAMEEQIQRTDRAYAQLEHER
jgi:hypothetical protein